MYKQDLALNKQPWLMYNKTKTEPNKTINQSINQNVAACILLSPIILVEKYGCIHSPLLYEVHTIGFPTIFV